MFRSLLVILVSIYSFNAFADWEVMSYNAENLFDTVHDADKEDWEYTPKDTPGKAEGCKKNRDPKKCEKADWTEAKLALKLSQLKEVFTLKGNLPDILGITEVENPAVVRRLADILGYSDFVMTNSPDVRGIDCAILYKKDTVKFIASREVPLRGENFVEHPTRNFIEAEFEINGERVFVYQNHWPSQTALTPVRLEVAKQFKTAIAEKAGAAVIAMGDFNVIDSENPHPINTVLTELTNIDDAYWALQKAKGYEHERALRYSRPPGTYFFKQAMTWNVLDKFLVSSPLRDGKGLEVDVESYEIFAPKPIRGSVKYFAATDFLAGSQVIGSPRYYNHDATEAAKAGYSDHFPIVVKLKAK